MTFKAPAPPGAGVDLKTLNGRLLLIKVLDVKHDIQTSYGPSKAVAVDLAVLDGPDKGTEHENTLLFPKVLFSQLERCVGDTILARLTQGVAKPGQSAPWMLDGPTDADQSVATKYQAWKLQQAATKAVEEDEEPF